MKICHMTDGHQSDDIRIFHKECASLAEAGYEVFLVAKGESREEKGVHVVGFGNPSKGRRGRMTKDAKRAYEKALALDCDVYHFHEPELLPYGLKLKKAGKKVIFDSHEDVPAQILDKQWIPAPLRKAVSGVYKAYETHAVKRLDAVVAATPHIAEQFEGRAKRVIVVNNYPRLDDIVFHEIPFEERERIVCYAGGIGELRGERVMVEAMSDVDGTLILAGPRGSAITAEEVAANSPAKEAIAFDGLPSEIFGGGASVLYVGRLDRRGVNELYGKSKLGLCVLLNAANYVNSQPIKMYEYMAAGLPFVCSDFPLWREVVEQTGAGVCVPSGNPKQIAVAVSDLLDDSEKCARMARNGRKAVEERYSWDVEQSKIVALYEGLTT